MQQRDQGRLAMRAGFIEDSFEMAAYGFDAERESVGDFIER